jgi:hypothetical protein
MSLSQHLPIEKEQVVLKARYRCSSCHQESDLALSLQEIETSLSGIQEACLICPECGSKKHIYYISEKLRQHQKEIKDFSLEWSRTQNKNVLWRLNRARLFYQQLFDEEQRRYNALLEKTEDDGRK